MSKLTKGEKAYYEAMLDEMRAETLREMAREDELDERYRAIGSIRLQ